MMSHGKAAFAVAMCLSVAPLLAADGILIVEKTTIGGKTQKNQVQIQGDMMRVEMTGAAGESQAVIFDGVKQVLWMVNYDKKTYTEMTKADLDRISGQMSDAMARVQDQMKSLPPAQQQQMAAMMAGRMGGAPAAPKTTYRKVGTDTVAKWTCDKYEGYQGTQKMVELCTVDPQAIGFAAADFQVTRQLADFFQKLAPQNAAGVFSLGTPEAQGFSGVPVRSVTFKGDQQQSVTEMSEATRQSFPASTFAPPPDFTKQAMGGRGGF
jgi:hypothetical protein